MRKNLPSTPHWGQKHLKHINESNMSPPAFPPVILFMFCWISPSIFVSFVSFFLFLSCDSVRIHPLLLPYRMLPLLSLEQKGSGPSSSPLLPPPAPSLLLLCNRSPVLLCLTPDLHNRPFVEGMPTSCSVLPVLLCVCRETETKLRCFFLGHTDVRCIRALRPLPWVCTMWGMCVSHSQSGFL